LLFGIWITRLGDLSVALGILGAGIAFALQEVIGSIAGWITIITGKPFTSRTVTNGKIVVVVKISPTGKLVFITTFITSKGENYDSGYYYCPYLLLIPQTHIIFKNTFTPQRPILRRVAKFISNSHYYGKIKVNLSQSR